MTRQEDRRSRGLRGGGGLRAGNPLLPSSGRRRVSAASRRVRRSTSAALRACAAGARWHGAAGRRRGAHGVGARAAGVADAAPPLRRHLRRWDRGAACPRAGSRGPAGGGGARAAEAERCRSDLHPAASAQVGRSFEDGRGRRRARRAAVAAARAAASWSRRARRWPNGSR
jgi:hypothetical protein